MKKIYWLSKIHTFLKTHWDADKKLLLGVSGGTDSKALFYAFMNLNLGPFEVVHIDHGWRKESAEQALHLKQEIEGKGIKFHCFRDNSSGIKRSENEAREKRLAVFQSFFNTGEYQAVVLAHHFNDLIETVLKRVLEGSHLPFFGGMDEISYWRQMPIWRPLLSVEKKELISFLEARGIAAIDDETNRDSKFLRARLRQEIFPFLNQTFKKNIGQNLQLLSHRSLELKKYLDRKVASISIHKEPSGIHVDLSLVEPIEARHCILKMLKEEGIVLSRIEVERILKLVASGLPNQSIRGRLFVDRGKFYIFSP